MEQKLSDTLVKAIDRSNPMMQNLQLASRFNKLVEDSESGSIAEPLAVTENGTYTAPSGKAYSPVTVNVPSVDLEDNKEISITENGTVEITPTEGKDGMKKVTANINVPSVSAFRYFDGRASGYAEMPIGFWVIRKNQISGNAHCLITSDDSSNNDSVKPIKKLTSEGLMVDEYGREIFPEVTEDFVSDNLG